MGQSMTVETAAGSLVKRQVRGAVLILNLARPPVNALNAALLGELAQALRDAGTDHVIRAVVLAAEGGQFSAGSDVSELGRVQGGALAPVTQLIEGLGKPVVAALHGTVMGGAMELALACHARVADEGARLGLPEIALGLLPAAGGTQRLPRLVGAPIALKLLLDGQPVSAVEALAMGLVDEVAESPALPRALDLAEVLAARPLRPASDRREGMRDGLAYQSAIAEARRRIEGWRLPAPAAVVDCVEAALLLPFDMGLAFEQARAEELATGSEAAGLRHAFLAEKRAVALPPALASAPRQRLASLAVLGTEGMVPEVARMALAAGMKVTLVAADRAALTAVLQKIAARQEAMVAAGRLTAAARDADWARLAAQLASEALTPVDLVLQAPDAPGLAAMPGPVLALGGRGPVVLHAPPVEGGLAQLAVAPATPMPLQVLAVALGRQLGWRVLVQGPGAALDQRLRLALSRAIAALESKGHDRQRIAAVLAAFGLGAGARPRLPEPPEGAAGVLSFCLVALMNEGARMVGEGVARRPSDVDAAALLSGLFPRWEGGPMYRADQIGLMALRADLRTRAVDHPQLFTPAPVIDQLIAEGRHLADLNRA